MILRYYNHNIFNKHLKKPDYFIQKRLHAAKLSVVNRAAQVAAVIESLERDMELLCVTGVEDKLQL